MADGAEILKTILARSILGTKTLVPPVTRIILYVKDIPKVAAFYQRHFGMTPLPSKEKGWTELIGDAGGCNIALH